MVTRRGFLKGVSAVMLAGSASKSFAAKKERPNILWITSEDMGQFLGCYGDKIARTPNLDKLAAEGVRYLNAYSNSPVCAPARNTIATGVLASSLGTSHMRSTRPLPAFVKSHSAYLKEQGYYTTNNSKTDYNTSSFNISKMWDQCDNKATYLNRKNTGQPFFSIFNLFESHESRFHKVNSDPKSFETDPAKVEIPPFLPDTPEIRNTLAKEYDQVAKIDRQTGRILDQLERSGEADNTIIFFYGDHGGAYPRTKRYLYQSGTLVPMIVKCPPKYKHLLPAAKGSAIDRLVCFADLAPTVLSIAGIKPPDYMQGKAFMGAYDSGEHEYIFNFADRFDESYRMSRMICDKKFLYIRNFTPNRTRGEYLYYYYKAPAVRSWREEYEAGRCNEIQSRVFKPRKSDELYDLEKDPWQINNLAENEEYSKTLARMKSAMLDYMTNIKDAGVLPEGYMISKSKGRAPYDMLREDKIDYNRILDAAILASENGEQNIAKLKKLLTDSEPACRYWAAMGLVFLGKEAAEAKSELEKAAEDYVADVRYAAFNALLNIGVNPSPIINSMLKDIKDCLGEVDKGKFYAGVNAANILVLHPEKCKPYKKEISLLSEKFKQNRKFYYFQSKLEHLLEIMD